MGLTRGFIAYGGQASHAYDGRELIGESPHER